MEHICPHCQSHRIVTRNYARKTCSTLGTFAGAGMAVRSVKVGTTIGRFFGPPGIVAGGMAGIVFAGLSGAILGNSTGSKLGSMLDDSVFNNYRCLSCRRTFSKPTQNFEGDCFDHEEFEYSPEEDHLPTSCD
jgi:hypothetical protein